VLNADGSRELFFRDPIGNLVQAFSTGKETIEITTSVPSGPDRFSLAITSDPQPWWWDGDYSDPTLGIPPNLKSLPFDEISRTGLTQNTNANAQLIQQYTHINSLFDLSHQPGNPSPMVGVIVNGDLTDGGNTQQLYDWNSARGALRPSLALYPSLGNHDYHNNVDIPGGEINDSPSRMVDWMGNWLKRNRGLLSSWDWRESATWHRGSLAYSTNIGQLHLVFLQLYPSYTREWVERGSLVKYTITSSMGWLEEDLALARMRGDAILVFTHSYDDDDEFASCLLDNSGNRLKDSAGNPIPNPDFVNFNELMASYQVSAVCAGHIHYICGQIDTITVSNTNIPVFRSGGSAHLQYLTANIDVSDSNAATMTLRKWKADPPTTISQPMAMYPLSAYKMVTGNDDPNTTGAFPATVPLVMTPPAL
jgi:hypothetical protein